MIVILDINFNVQEGMVWFFKNVSRNMYAKNLEDQ